MGDNTKYKYKEYYIGLFIIDYAKFLLTSTLYYISPINGMFHICISSLIKVYFYQWGRVSYFKFIASETENKQFVWGVTYNYNH